MADPSGGDSEARPVELADTTGGAVKERRPIVRSLLVYLRRPRSFEPHDRSPKWWASLKLLGIDFALLIPFGFVAYVASKGIDSETFIADEGLTTAEIIVFGVVLAPLIEESAFRLWITRLRPAFLVVGGLLMLLFATGEAASLALLVPAVLLVGIAIAARPDAGIVAGRADRRRSITHVWDGHFGWVFYGSAAVFGLIHLFNYDLGVADGADLTLAPLLIAPQLAGGLVLAYTRVRLGFWYAVANHAVYNALLTIPEVIAAG